MSDEQDVRAAGWVDPRGRHPEGGATAAVVPGQRREGEPGEVPVGAPDGPPVEQATADQTVVEQAVVEQAVVEQARAEQAPPGAVPAPTPMPEPGPTPHPTAPLGARPRPRLPRRDPLIRMGPWAPVAGAVVGLVAGVVVVLFLAPAVDTFDQRLTLVFVVLGLCLLGAGGTLLADEVRILRRGTQAAEARASGAEVIAGLLNGLTPARLLIAASAFVLLLGAWVGNKA